MQPGADRLGPRAEWVRMKLKEIAKRLKKRTGKTTEQLYEEFVQLCDNQRMTKTRKTKHAYCEICELVTEWKCIGPMRDEKGRIVFWLWNCLDCGGTRRLNK